MNSQIRVCFNVSQEEGMNLRKAVIDSQLSDDKKQSIVATIDKSEKHYLIVDARAKIMARAAELSTSACDRDNNDVIDAIEAELRRIRGSIGRDRWQHKNNTTFDTDVLTFPPNWSK